MASWRPGPRWDVIDKLCARLGSCFRSHGRLLCALPVAQLRACASASSLLLPQPLQSYKLLEAGRKSDSAQCGTGEAGASPALPPPPKFPHCRGGTFRVQALQEGAGMSPSDWLLGSGSEGGKRMPVAKSNLKRGGKGLSLPCDSSAQPQMHAGTLTGAPR